MSSSFKLEELVDLTDRYKEHYRGKILDVKIENLVLKGTTNQLLNLAALAERLIHLGPQYEVDKFSSLIFTSFSMAVLLFQQCSFLCVGAKDIIDVLQYNRRLAQEIRQAYPNFKILSLDVVNAVVNISLDNLNGSIDVKRFAEDNKVTCTYIPGKFPGARYRPKLNGLETNALIFKSGQINIVGVNTHQDLINFIDNTLEIIEPYKEAEIITSNSSQTVYSQQTPSLKGDDLMASSETFLNVPEVFQMDKDDLLKYLHH